MIVIIADLMNSEKATEEAVKGGKWAPKSRGWRGVDIRKEKSGRLEDVGSDYDKVMLINDIITTVHCHNYEQETKFFSKWWLQ